MQILLTDRPLEKLWGRGGGEIFDPQEFFSLSNSLYEFFLGRSINMAWGYLACMNFFFHLIFPCTNFFFVLATPSPPPSLPPPDKFSNGPSLSLWMVRPNKNGVNIYIPSTSEKNIWKHTHWFNSAINFNYFVFQLMPVASLNHFKLFQSCNNHTNEWLSKLLTTMLCNSIFIDLTWFLPNLIWLFKRLYFQLHP